MLAQVVGHLRTRPRRRRFHASDGPSEEQPGSTKRFLDRAGTHARVVARHAVVLCFSAGGVGAKYNDGPEQARVLWPAEGEDVEPSIRGVAWFRTIRDQVLGSLDGRSGPFGGME